MSTILVVEDEPAIRENICSVLELEGFDVSDAFNGKDGLAKVQAQKLDLICCDVFMPEMDGYEFVQRLRSQAQYATIPIIFLSARTSDEDIKKGLMMGANAYLKKPYNTSDLLNTINRLLKQSS